MFDVTITIPDLDAPTSEEAAERARLFLGTEVMLHDLIFTATGRDGQGAHVELKGHDVELPLMLVLCTSHLTRATAGLFEMKTDDLPIHHDKGEYGWIIPLETGIDWPHTCPPELIGIREFAEKLGATWIMLDRDADLVEGLPSWEW